MMDLWEWCASVLTEERWKGSVGLRFLLRDMARLLFDMALTEDVAINVHVAKTLELRIYSTAGGSLYVSAHFAQLLLHAAFLHLSWLDMDRYVTPRAALR